MASLSTQAANKWTHDTFATSTTFSARTIPARCNTIIVNNPDATISLLISLDGGATFMTLAATRPALTINGSNIQTFGVKSASGTPNCEVLYGSEV